MTKYLLSILVLVFTLFSPAFGQEQGLTEDLSKSFRVFSLTRFEASGLTDRIGSGRTISVTAGSDTFELNLAPHDLRAPNYKAEDTTIVGTRRLDRGPVTTFKGTVAGVPGSIVRMAIIDKSIEGFWVSGGEMYFIESAAIYSKYAAADQFVVYRHSDVLRSDVFSCKSELIESVKNGKELVVPSPMTMGTGLNVVEIATEADSDFVATTGTSQAANDKILSILNMVEGLYEPEIGLTVSVTFQHTYATPSVDPFDPGANASGLLNAFRTLWNAQYPTDQYPRDTAHLFTYKQNARGQGFAFLGVICNNAPFAYGLSGRVDPSWQWEQANFLVTSHEIGHNLGANHSDGVSGCSNFLMNSELTSSTQLSFCTYSRGEVGNFVGANGSCLTPARTRLPLYDYDGDGKTDPAIFRPSNGTWFIANSTGGFNIFQFGQAGDIPVGGDFDGDGKSDPTIYRNGVWWRFKSANSTVDAIAFGLATDVPAPGDFDGDGKSDVVVFRPSSGVWHLLSSASGGYSASQFGINGDLPTALDYDGDGKADISVFRPSNGVWYRINSADQSFFAAGFGLSGDKPVAGDFDGDGKADLAVFRPSNGVWYAMRSSDSNLFAVSFGLSTDVPVVADFDGDARSDVAVWRPSNGVWHRLLSSNGGYQSSQFGIGSDVPVQAR